MICVLADDVALLVVSVLPTQSHLLSFNSLQYYRLPRVSCSMVPQEQARLYLLVPWHPTLMPHSSRSSLLPLSTSTLENRLVLFAKCFPLLVITNPVSFSWTKLMPLEVLDSPKEHLPIGKFNELSWNYSIKWMALKNKDKSKWSWPPIVPIFLDPALLRPGRLDRKIEIPEPNETQRLEILKIHAGGITKRGDIDFESVVKLADGLNGADMRNICTEAGLFAIRSDRDYVLEEDFMKAARKILDSKKLESKLDYSKV